MVTLVAGLAMSMAAQTPVITHPIGPASTERERVMPVLAARESPVPNSVFHSWFAASSAS